MNRPWKRHRKLLFQRQGGRCADCSTAENHLRSVNGRRAWLTTDHIIKRADGGSDNPDNLQLLCLKCHSLKDNQVAS